MRKGKEIIVLLLILFVNIARSDTFHNPVNREDPCVNLCENTPLFFTSVRVPTVKFSSCTL